VAQFKTGLNYSSTYPEKRSSHVNFQQSKSSSLSKIPRIKISIEILTRGVDFFTRQAYRLNFPAAANVALSGVESGQDFKRISNGNKRLLIRNACLLVNTIVRLA
jgi:hypothetical protein